MNFARVNRQAEALENGFALHARVKIFDFQNRCLAHFKNLEATPGNRSWSCRGEPSAPGRVRMACLIQPSTDAALQADAEELLRLDGKLHG